MFANSSTRVTPLNDAARHRPLVHAVPTGIIMRRDGFVIRTNVLGFVTGRSGNVCRAARRNSHVQVAGTVQIVIAGPREDLEDILEAVADPTGTYMPVFEAGPAHDQPLPMAMLAAFVPQMACAA